MRRNNVSRFLLWFKHLLFAKHKVYYVSMFLLWFKNPLFAKHKAYV